MSGRSPSVKKIWLVLASTPSEATFDTAPHAPQQTMVKSENASQRGKPARVAAELRSDAGGGGTICAPGFAQYTRERPGHENSLSCPGFHRQSLSLRYCNPSAAAHAGAD